MGIIPPPKVLDKEKLLKHLKETLGLEFIRGPDGKIEAPLHEFRLTYDEAIYVIKLVEEDFAKEFKWKE